MRGFTGLTAAGSGIYDAVVEDDGISGLVRVRLSFPSGHALNSTVIAGMVAYLLVRRLRTRWARAAAVIVAIAWALAMGLSRVFLGHHWLTDVIFAWLLGAAWLALLITSHRLFLTIRRVKPAEERG